LESVLEEVRNRFGDTATIVEANRLRKGGVGGFFAKERYEVVVDVEDGPTVLPPDFGLEATEDFRDRLLSLADDVDDVDGTTPVLSTEQPAFTALLDSITRHMEAPDGPPPAPFVPAPAPVPVPAAAAPPAPPGSDPSAWLLNLLAKIPAAERLPQAPGSVIVVAGSRDPALRL